MKNKINSDVENCEYVAATPIKILKNKISFGESTIIPREKDLIVIKKKRGN